MTKWKKLSRNGYVLYDSNSMTFWKRQNYGDSEKIHGGQGLRGEKNKFLEQWNYPVWYHNNDAGDCVCVCVYVCTLVLSRVWLFNNIYCILPCMIANSCLVAKSCPTLCDSMDVAHQTPVHGISQTRILEWVAISSSSGYSWPRDWTHVSCIGRRILYHWASREAHECQ